MNTSSRRHDIDWLRVIAIGLLLIYHIAIVFQPWGILIRFMQSEKSLESLWIPMSMLNVWRIPLLFFVSGMGVCFAIKKRNWKQLILERTKRILVPLIFGIVAIVPVHVLIWQNYYNQDLAYTPGQSHLWFLLNIFTYVLILFPLFFYLKSKRYGRFNTWLRKLYSNPLGLLLVTVCIVLEALLVNPEIYTLYAFTLHGYLLGFLAFFFGFTFVLNGSTFWNTVLTWRWALLIISLVLYFYRYYESDLAGTNPMLAVETCTWMFCIFGFVYKHLNRPSKALSYLSQGAYPIYILHMLFLYLGASLILPLSIPITFQFVLISLFTFAGCFVGYEFIRRVKFIRPLFGMKFKV